MARPPEPIAQETGPDRWNQLTHNLSAASRFLTSSIPKLEHSSMRWRFSH